MPLLARRQLDRLGQIVRAIAQARIGDGFIIHLGPAFGNQPLGLFAEGESPAFTKS